LGAASVLRPFRVGAGTIEPLESAGFSKQSLRAVAVSPASRRLLVARASGRRVLELAIDPSPGDLLLSGGLRLERRLLRVRVTAADVSVSWR
jgi:hypothetical protein